MWGNFNPSCRCGPGKTKLQTWGHVVGAFTRAESHYVLGRGPSAMGRHCQGRERIDPVLNRGSGPIRTDPESLWVFG